MAHQQRGVTLIELLCVIAILAILASMLLPAVFRAYGHARGFVEEFEGSEIASLLLNESRRYCVANPRYHIASKSEFVEKCGFSPKSRAWVNASSTEFVAFNWVDATNKLVLAIHVGRRKATHYVFTKAELTMQPPEAR